MKLNKKIADSLRRQSMAGVEAKSEVSVFSRRRAVIIAAFTLLCLLHVWSRLYMVDINLKISAAKQARRELNQELQRLQVEVTSLRTPHRIESFAKEQLDMIAPSGQQVIIVDEGHGSVATSPAGTQSKLSAVAARRP